MKLAPWLDETWRSLSERLQHGRLPHALMLSGAGGLGKRALADALVAAALCESRGGDGYACTRCRSCLLMAAGSHPDRVHLSFEMRDDGKTPRTEIVIEQIRNLSQRLSLSSQFGGMQMAIIDPADRMNPSAANALLKTLEEPSGSTMLVLVSDQPSRLPATIRSRCQRIQINPPGHAQAVEWLRGQGIANADAERALTAMLGNPGRARDALADDTLSLRSECLRDLQALSGHRARALTVAEAWAADRPDQRLWHAAVLVREDAIQLAQGSRGTLGLTGPAEIPKLAAWFAAANRSRELLATQVRSDLVVLDLLHTWQTPRSS
ncbi:MAG TPA: DNA polymerase III subunit delta' [Dokdonella sp.]|uniref:DNA polymerase III subunit delta' n=1 Tax=Dokdonella sp. TaxID=2291710 RepID=UPI002D7F132B|nr:DNA polymerase III subunit delta' [Dokdonella sp.]HET9031284.1 DNA polymerase III subunit delta' [Dokdonella sp.]